MNSDTVLNPYELLSIDPYNPNMKQLKKNYYSLVKICHPDKGGSEKAMRTIQYAYAYIKLQFLNCKDLKTYEQLENEFTQFCKTQEQRESGFKFTYNKEGGDDYASKQKKFNEKFEAAKKNNITSFDKGYGTLMSESEYTKGKLSYDNTNISKKHKHVFTNIDNNSLTVYREPESFLQSYGNHERFDVKKVKDFSYTTGKLYMSDYQNAFKMLGEKNVRKVKIENRTYDGYIQQRKNNQDSYKMATSRETHKYTRQESSESSESGETSSDSID